MLDILENYWQDIAKIIIGLVLGIGGGVSYKIYKNKNISKVKGNGNIVIQKGSDTNEN